LSSNANETNRYVRMLGPKTLRKSSAMPLSALFLNEVATRNPSRDTMSAGRLKDSIHVSQTGAMTIDLHALDAAHNPHDVERHSRAVLHQTNNNDQSRVSVQFASPLTQKLVNKYLPARPDEDGVAESDRNAGGSGQGDVVQVRSSSVGAPASSQQVSRPDLLGIADNTRSVRKRPTNSVTFSQPGGGEGIATHQPVSPSHRSSSAPPLPPTTAPKPDANKGMFKVMSGFFRGLQ
jgi:hypothetical protein